MQGQGQPMAKLLMARFINNTIIEKGLSGMCKFLKIFLLQRNYKCFIFWKLLGLRLDEEYVKCQLYHE